MKAMLENDAPDSLDQVREVLNRALPDGTMHIEVTLREHSKEANKWIRFTEALHRESPLRGKAKLHDATGSNNLD